MRIAVIIVLSLMLTACASTPRSDGRASVGDEVAATALAMSGAPYRYGGTSPSGFDCSGLVYFAYDRSGIKVPRTTRSQYKQAKRVPMKELRAGDLVFFRIAGKVSHVGLYTGDGRFVHAPSSGRSVMISRLDSDYWRKRLVATGRLH